MSVLQKGLLMQNWVFRLVFHSTFLLIGMSVDVPGMCKNSLYTADLLILPSDLLIYASVAESMLKLGRIATKNQHLTAVLIHTPEHYERNQAKRIDIRAAHIVDLD